MNRPENNVPDDAQGTWLVRLYLLSLLQANAGNGPRLKAVAAVLCKDTSAIVTLAGASSMLHPRAQHDQPVPAQVTQAFLALMVGSMDPAAPEHGTHSSRPFTTAVDVLSHRHRPL